VAREKLSTRANATSFGRDGANAPSRTWAGYCEDIGINKSTANRWLAQYFGGTVLATPSTGTRGHNIDCEIAARFFMRHNKKT